MMMKEIELIGCCNQICPDPLLDLKIYLGPDLEEECFRDRGALLTFFFGKGEYTPCE